MLSAPPRPLTPKTHGTERNPFIEPPPDAQDAAYVASLIALGPQNGTTYSFTVAAYTQGGNGPRSLEVSAMPLAPPGGVTAASGDTRVTLDWQPSTAASSYIV